MQEEKAASNEPSIPFGLDRGGFIDWHSKFKAYSLSTQPKRGSVLENLVLQCQVAPHNSPVRAVVCDEP